jgi:glycosyltransferase involved in cell wall biosynthesis
LRAQLGISPGAVLVGMIARLHPMKDPGTLIEAVRLARGRGADIHLLLVGHGMDRLPSPLACRAAALPADRLTLLGQRDDMPRLMPGLDILVLPSAWGEGFPNTLAEAMACGVPCVTTDVGDSGRVVGETGKVVPPRDPEAIAAALIELIGAGQSGRRALGEKARRRVLDKFALDRVGARFARLYGDVLRRRVAWPPEGARSPMPGRVEP